MTNRSKLLVVAVMMLVAITTMSSQSRPEVTPADYLRWSKELRNWGRWGPDDQKGPANLITPQKVVAATRLVRTGTVVSLAHAVPQEQAADVGAAQVFRRTTNNISATATTDNYQVSYHGQSLSHMDALCHYFIDGQMYNGYPVKENISPETGCKKNDIMARRDGIVTRGVLYDMPQMKGVEWLEPGTPVTRADLEAWEKRTGTRVGPGDMILLYVGRWKRRAALGAHKGAVAGYYVDTVPFFRQRDVAFVGHDMNIDWSPRPGWGPEQGIIGSPVHHPLLTWFGAAIVENLDLEELAATARKLKRYEFMVTFAPIPVEGGSGSPVNPLALF